MIFKQCSTFLLYISILKLKDSILIEIKNIVDHRTTWRLGATDISLSRKSVYNFWLSENLTAYLYMCIRVIIVFLQ